MISIECIKLKIEIIQNKTRDILEIFSHSNDLRDQPITRMGLISQHGKVLLFKKNERKTTKNFMQFST